jgi:hypothetical protein
MGEEKQGLGCGAKVGIGCGVLAVIGIVLGVVVYVKAKDLARVAGAKGVEIVAEAMMDEAELAADEKAAAMEPVREFAQQIRDGKVTLEQAIAVGEALAKGPAFAAVLMRGFEAKYLAKSELPDEEKAEARVTISRFVHGVSTEMIPPSKAEEISNLVTYETTGPGGEKTTTLKESITTEELRSCIKVMKDAADGAGIEDTEFTFDIADEIRKAIEKGMATTAGSP